MNDWFNTAGVEPSAVLLRLIAALVLGGAVAWIHERTSRGSGGAAGSGVENGNSFAATLVLLAVLIAAVTQVIGDNVARAFSLVGALSIVRFRTVVRDTRDTAFVIFAVVVGMAAGAQNLWVALFCLVVAGSAAFVLAARPESGGGPEGGAWRPDQTLRVRAAMAVPVERSVGDALAARGWRHRLTSIGTAKLGTTMEATWDLALPAGQSAEELIREIGRIDGIQDVRLGRAGSEENLSK